MSDPLLSILIVNWNSGPHLERCLESIYQNPPDAEFEVIVVDNASRDGSAECITKFKGIEMIRNDYNYGFSYANNQAFSASFGDLILPLNPDTRVPPRLLSLLVRIMNDNPDIGILAPLTETDGNLVNPGYDLRLFYRSHLLSLLKESRQGHLDEPEASSLKKSGDRASLRDVKFIRGTGYICRRSALGGDHLFEPRSFLFGEEFHLCLAITKAGFRIAVTTEGRLNHAKSVSFKTVPTRKAVAEKLLQASHWDERLTYFGSVPALLSHVVRVLDLVMLSLLGGLKSILSTSEAGARYSGLARKYRRDAWTLARLVVFRRKEFLEINSNAAMFFNDGEDVPRELKELWGEQMSRRFTRSLC